jgi:hypothetical protein
VSFQQGYRVGSANDSFVLRKWSIRNHLRASGTDKPNNGGCFNVAVNSAGPTDISFPSSSTNSRLTFVGHSDAWADTSLSLNPAYEGNLYAEATYYNEEQMPTIHVNEYAQDPTGQGRKRNYKLTREGKRFENNIARGWVAWDEPDSDAANWGSVSLKTRYRGAKINA